MSAIDFLGDLERLFLIDSTCSRSSRKLQIIEASIDMLKQAVEDTSNIE